MPDANPGITETGKWTDKLCINCNKQSVGMSRAAKDGMIVITYTCMDCRQIWATAPMKLVQTGVVRPGSKGTKA